MNTLPEPIGRLAFLARFSVAIVANVLLYLLFVWALWFATGRDKENVSLVALLFGVWFVAFLFWVMCFIRFVIIARLVSIGMSRWSALLLLVPMVGFVFVLFLLFCPANKMPNQALQPTATAPSVLTEP